MSPQPGEDDPDQPSFDISNSARDLLAGEGGGGNDSNPNLLLDNRKGSVHSAPAFPTSPLSAGSTASSRRKVGRHSAAIIDRVSIFDGTGGSNSDLLGGGGSGHGGGQRQSSLGFDALVSPRKRAARPSLVGRIQQFDSPSGHKGNSNSSSQRNVMNPMGGSGSGHRSSKLSSNDAAATMQALLSPRDVKKLLKANTKKRESIIKIVDQLETINKEERAIKTQQKQSYQLYAEKSEARKERKRQNFKSKKTWLGEQGRISSRSSTSTNLDGSDGTRRSSSASSNRRRSSAGIRQSTSSSDNGGGNDFNPDGVVLEPWKEVRAVSYDFTNFEPKKHDKPKTPDEIDLIRNVVNTNVVFSEIQYTLKGGDGGGDDDDEEYDGIPLSTSFTDNYESFSSLPVYDTLIDAFEPVEFDVGEVIMKQGEENRSLDDCHMYIVQEGKVEFKVDGVTVGTAIKGESFGEDALLYNAAAPVSVHVADTDDNDEAAKLLRLDQKTFRGIMYTHSKTLDDEKQHLIKSIDFLKDLIAEEPQLVSSLAQIMSLQGFTDGQTAKANPETTFYVVQGGMLQVTGTDNTGNNVDYRMSFGDYLGEDALFKDHSLSTSTGSTSSLTLKGMQNGGTYYTIDRVTLEKCLGPNRLRRLRDKLQLADLPIVKNANLNSTALDVLMDKIVDESYDEGHEIAAATDVGADDENVLYIIREGTVEVKSAETKTTKDVCKGGIFPEAAAVGERRQKRQGFTATAKEPVVLGMLPLDELDSVQQGMQAEPKGTDVDDHHPVSEYHRKREELHVSVQSNIQLEDLEKISLLGEGQFGEVWLVAADVFQTGIDELKQKFALKSQYKTDDIRGEDTITAIRQEISMIQSIQHPGILDLVNVYEDSESIYMLMGLIPGGELWDVIHKEQEDGEWKSGISDESAVAFYALGIADTLGHLHSKGVAFRDLKPENVMIDAEGYPIIIDFGFAKTLKIDEKAYTFCGTPNYVAPEIIKNAGHNGAVDYWALGVLIYEMIAGENPFYFDGMDQVELFEAICHENYYQFPDELGPSKEAIEVVDLLLEKDPAQRLGVLAGGVDDILTHDWFSKHNLDISRMRNKMLKAPWRPLSDDDDGFAVDVDDEIDLHHIIEEEDEHEEEEESPEAIAKPQPNTILDIQAPALDPSTRDEDDNEDLAAVVTDTAVEAISPRSNLGGSIDSSSPSKKKVTLKYNVISPRREQSKEEKEKESKERRATVSGALLASLSDDDYSTDEDVLASTQTDVVVEDVNHRKKGKDGMDTKKGTPKPTSGSPSVNSSSEKQAVGVLTAQPQLKKKKNKKSDSSISDHQKPLAPTPPPSTAPKSPISPISPSTPAAVSLLSPTSRSKLKVNMNKGYHSPKMSKEEREKVSKARRETVNGSVKASLAGLGINDSDDEK